MDKKKLRFAMLKCYTFSYTKYTNASIHRYIRSKGLCEESVIKLNILIEQINIQTVVLQIRRCFKEAKNWLKEELGSNVGQYIFHFGLFVAIHKVKRSIYTGSIDF